MIAHSPAAHARFTARREHGDSYSAAARNLTNRGIGMLHHCLQTRQHYEFCSGRVSDASLRALMQ
jgi:hypothetical protein